MKEEFKNKYYYLIFFAGFPTTVELSATFFNTTAPAPIIEYFPILTLGIITAPV